jgi:hypothetical protein
LDKEVVKKIRVFDILLESRDISTPGFMRLYPILALFPELVEVNYIVKQSRLWKGIEWAGEYVDGHIRINEVRKTILATREAWEASNREGLRSNVPAEEITKVIQKIKAVKLGCQWALSRDIDLDPAAADGSTALVQAVNERIMA